MRKRVVKTTVYENERWFFYTLYGMISLCFYYRTWYLDSKTNEEK